MSGRIAGPIELTVNGLSIDIKGNWEYSLGGFEDEEILSPTGEILGYAGKAEAASIEGTAVLTKAMMDMIEELADTEDGTVSLKLPMGKIFMLSEARQVLVVKGNTESAEAKLKFVGEKDLL